MCHANLNLNLNLFLTVVITVVNVVFLIISVVVYSFYYYSCSVVIPTIVDALFTDECMPHCRSCSPHNHYVTNTT